MEVPRLVLEFVQALVWPVVALVAIIVFRKPIVAILNRLKGADLPGGVSLNFEEEIRDARQLSREVESGKRPQREQRGPSIPLTEANARMISLGLQPSPSGLDANEYRVLAEQDPNLALAGLRMELEILARNLAKGFNVPAERHDSAGTIFRKLHDHHAITMQQYQLAQNVIRLCSAALHGTTVSRQEAESVVDVAKVLADQYLAWLSWGFDDGWQPRQGRPRDGA